MIIRIKILNLIFKKVRYLIIIKIYELGIAGYIHLVKHK
jgi:hypothetical protein